MKKVSVIGAGLYGCYFSYKIKESFPNCEVVLYEKNSGIMLEASTNNQHRLHLGYHYPRSEKTIEEVIRNAKKFEQEFKDCLTVLDNNFYLIHKNSLVDFEQYVRVYDKFKLEHKVVAKEKIKSYLTDVENIEGVLDTKEKCIDNHKVRNVIEKRMKMSGVKIVLNTEVDIKDVAPHTDLVINTTYTNPNMGLTNKSFELKYELCIIPVIKNFWNKNMAMTIMDGNFASIYPDAKGNLTLSSVLHTPFFKTDNYGDFVLKYNQFKNANLDHEVDLLLSDVRKYFDIKDITSAKLYKSPKIKIKHDVNDERCSHILKEGNIITVLNGKLSSVCEVYEEIEKSI